MVEGSNDKKRTTGETHASILEDVGSVERLVGVFNKKYLREGGFRIYIIVFKERSVFSPVLVNRTRWRSRSTYRV